MTWTQPICIECWYREQPGRTPTVVKNDSEERCCMCNKVTTAGIYVRKNPALVPHPRRVNT